MKSCRPVLLALLVILGQSLAMTSVIRADDAPAGGMSAPSRSIPRDTALSYGSTHPKGAVTFGFYNYAEDAVSGGAYTGVSAQWTVPIGPSNTNDPVVGLWDGIAGTYTFGNFLVQAILGWGCLQYNLLGNCNTGGKYWYVVSEWLTQPIGDGNNANYGAFVAVSPGDTISGTVTSISNPSGCGPSTPNEFLVTTNDLTTGHGSAVAWCYQLNGGSPNEVFGADLELNRFDTCDQLPSISTERFTSVSSTPATTTWQVGTDPNAPSCNFSPSSPSSARVNFQWTATPGVDGSAGYVAAYGGTTITVTLSTSQSNDIIVLYAASLAFSSQPPHVSSISDSAGLAWASRIGGWSACGSSDNCEVDEWYAQSPNRLSSDSITATFAPGISGVGSWVIAFGVSGANYNKPWDGQATAGASSSSTPLTSIVTAVGDDMLIGFAAQRNGNPWNAGYGFTLIGGNNGFQAAENGIAVAPGAQTVEFYSHISDSWIIIADAIQPGFSPPPALDGSASGSAYGGTTITVSLSTSKPNDIIVLDAASFANGQPPQVSSVSDSANLVWTHRISLQGACGSGNTCDADEWYAKSPNPLSSDSITATFAAGITGVGSRVIVFGVSGANYANPWDVASPSTNTGSSGNNPSASITTVSTADMLIGYAMQRQSSPWTAGTGFTFIQGSSYYWEAVEYGMAIDSGVQTVQFTSSISNPWLIIADAIKPA